MSDHTIVRPSEPSAPASLAARGMAAFFAAMLGAFILLGVGFLGSETLHNAAHDSRHSFAFPCH